MDQQPAVVPVLSDRHLRSGYKVFGADVNLSATVELLLLTVGAPLHLPVRLLHDTPQHLLKLPGLVTVPAIKMHHPYLFILKYLPFLTEPILDPRMVCSTML